MILSVVKSVFKFVGNTIVYTYTAIGMAITAAVAASAIIAPDKLKAVVICITGLIRMDNLANQVSNFFGNIFG